MKKAIYPLQQVLEIKLRRVEEAEKVVKEKKAALDQENERLAQRKAERDKVQEHYKDKMVQLRAEMDQSTTSTKIQQMKAYLKVVQEKLKVEEKKVKEQQVKVDQAEKALDEAKKQLQLKRVEVDKLEIHRKDWEKEQRKESEIKEEREQDEIGNVIYGRHHHKREY